MEKKKTVGIMTLYFNYNYGALLQAYALNQTICEFGFEVEDIRYLREINDKPTKIKKTYDMISKKIIKVLKDPKKVKKVIEKIQYTKVKSTYKLKEKTALRRKYFDEFISKEIKESQIAYDGHKEIGKVINDYDIFVCGSDNIWNKNMLDTSFMLDFVPDDKLKVAYAPGMSANSLNKKQVMLIKPILERIHYLSCREKMGAKLVSDITSRNVEVVLDPTLLRTKEQWQLMAKKPEVELPERYIFCYLCGENKIIRDKIKLFSKSKNIKIVNFPFVASLKSVSDIGFGDSDIFNAGPGEFLYLIKNAAYVITDSFHGSIFSIHFEKKFVCFYRFFEEKNFFLNFRIDNLLDNLHVDANRILKNDEANIMDIIDAEIDYKSIKSRLSEQRKTSLQYLDNALRDGDNIL